MPDFVPFLKIELNLLVRALSVSFTFLWLKRRKSGYPHAGEGTVMPNRTYFDVVVEASLVRPKGRSPIVNAVVLPHAAVQFLR